MRGDGVGVGHVGEMQGGHGGTGVEAGRCDFWWAFRELDGGGVGRWTQFEGVGYLHRDVRKELQRSVDGILEHHSLWSFSGCRALIFIGEKLSYCLRGHGVDVRIFAGMSDCRGAAWHNQRGVRDSRRKNGKFDLGI